MDTINPIPLETEAAIRSHGGPVLPLKGAEGRYVLMTSDAFEALLGLNETREEVLASVRRGIEDTMAGRTRPAAEVFDDLEKKYGA